MYLARQEQGQPAEDVIAAAASASLDITDSLASVRRVVARDQVCVDLAAYESDHTSGAVRSADPARTDRLLDAYHAGDRVVLHHAGLLGHMLVDEGRNEELWVLHATFPIPTGSKAAQHMRALGNLSYTVLLDPGVPAEVVEEAESRVRWILETKKAARDADLTFLAALRHTMAVVRLRQGKFSAVEALCADSLALSTLPLASRGDVLATVVLARQALGRRHGSLLAQAVRLAPEAPLVKEARQDSSR